MDQSEAEQLHRKLLTASAATHAQVVRLQERLAGIDKMLEGLEQWYPTLASVPTEEAERTVASGAAALADDATETPRGTKAVLAILTEEPDRWFTAREVTERLNERGWSPKSDRPEEPVRAALNRASDYTNDVDRQRRQTANGRMTTVYRLRRRASAAVSGALGFGATESRPDSAERLAVPTGYAVEATEIAVDNRNGSAGGHDGSRSSEEVDSP